MVAHRLYLSMVSIAHRKLLWAEASPSGSRSGHGLLKSAGSAGTFAPCSNPLVDGVQAVIAMAISAAESL